MKKVELLEKIFQKLESEGIAIDQGLLTKIFDVFLRSIKDAVINDETLELRGFGTFLQKKRAKRIAWNPTTKQKFQVEEKIIPYFKPGSIFKKEVLNGSLTNNTKEK